MPPPSAPRAILVVDDDVELLRFLRETLPAFATCTVETTPSPQYAFELTLKKAYDLFIFDFAMPVVDGAVLYAFISKVYLHEPGRAGRALPPLLLMSGNAEQPRARQLLHEPGVKGLLPKPFSIDRLLSKIEACLPGVVVRTGT